MRTQRTVRLTVCLLALGLAAGCVTPLMMAESTSPLAGRSPQAIGPTEAESCIQSVLGIPFQTDASLQTSLRLARERVGADALIEVVVDRWNLTTFFYNKSCTVVHAIGVRFGAAPAASATAAPAAAAQPAPGPAAAAPAPAPARPAAAAPATPAPAPKKLSRAERRRQAAEERKRRALEKRQAREEARRQAAEEKKRQAEEQKNKAEAQKKKAEEQKRLAEEQKKKAEEQKRLAEESKPVPAEFGIFCKYRPGQPILVETKAEKVEAEFVKCIHSGLRVRRAGQQPEVIPFGTIWSVRMRAAASSGPAQPAQPAQPGQ